MGSSRGQGRGGGSAGSEGFASCRRAPLSPFSRAPGAQLLRQSGGRCKVPHGPHLSNDISAQSGGAAVGSPGGARPSWRRTIASCSHGLFSPSCASLSSRPLSQGREAHSQEAGIRALTFLLGPWFRWFGLLLSLFPLPCC